MINRASNIVKLIPLQAIYLTIILCFICTFIWGCFIFTIEPDESWMLMSSMKAFGIELVETSALNLPVTTTGGIHVVIHGLMSLLNSDILLHRFVSILFSAILLFIVFIVATYSLKDRILAAAGTAAFAATPGFLLQSSLATGEIIATPIILLASLFWTRFGAKSVYFAIFGGLLFGLACATRMTCLAILPAILIWSFLVHKRWRERLLYPVVAIAVAVVVFTASVSAYSYAFGTNPAGVGTATGLGLSYGGGLMRLNYLLVSEGILPSLFIIGLVAWYVSRLESPDDPEVMQLCGFLLIAGIGAWAAWVVKAPIAHIRYLWPAIPLLWLTAILLGLARLKRVKNPMTALAVHATIVGVCLVQGLFNVRMLAVGESLTIAYEFARETTLGTPREYFAARNDQEAIIRAVSDLPASGNIYSLMVPATYPITYAAGRTIKPLQKASRLFVGDFLIVVPSDRNIWEPSWDLIRWVQENTLLLERHGGYALYTLRQGASIPDISRPSAD